MPSFLHTHELLSMLEMHIFKYRRKSTYRRFVILSRPPSPCTSCHHFSLLPRFLRTAGLKARCLHCTSIAHTITCRDKHSACNTVLVLSSQSAIATIAIQALHSVISMCICISSLHCSYVCIWQLQFAYKALNAICIINYILQSLKQQKMLVWDRSIWLVRANSAKGMRNDSTFSIS